MIITAIETPVVGLPFDMGGPHPAFAGRPWGDLDILLVRVETDDGLVGWGEAFGHAAIPSTKAALDTIVAPLALGRDAGQVVSDPGAPDERWVYKRERCRRCAAAVRTWTLASRTAYACAERNAPATRPARLAQMSGPFRPPAVVAILKE